MTKPLDSGSIAVYDAIERHYSLRGQSPSILQIMAETGFKSSNSVARHLNRLEQAGWITREPHQLHAIIPIRQPRVHCRRADAAPNWVCSAPNYTDYCPDCQRSINASPNGRNPDRFTQRDPFTDVDRQWKPKPNTDSDDHAITDPQR